ncbi:hypothetical protein [Panacagrimonas perspica]|uniref:hypothetical protein n=1 Tax=Panacagrimonas perspica TaxID=381431 RepID=UPI0010609D80|nr:hypothetical protein [Panacagrimonas perspica]
MAARAMTWGVALGFFASGTGVIEILLRRIPPAGFVRLVMHAGAVHAGLICCLVSLLMRKPGGPSLAAALVGFAGTAILGSGGS